WPSSGIPACGIVRRSGRKTSSEAAGPARPGKRAAAGDRHLVPLFKVRLRPHCGRSAFATGTTLDAPFQPFVDAGNVAFGGAICLFGLWPVARRLGQFGPKAGSGIAVE